MPGRLNTKWEINAAALRRFSGSFAGRINQVPATITLSQKGVSIEGEVVVAGERYALTGTASGATARGSMVHALLGTRFEFQASMDQERMILDFAVINRQDGQVLPRPFREQSKHETGIAVGGERRSKRLRSTMQCDPALVGMWVHQDFLPSALGPDSAAAAQVFMEILSDGTYVHGNAQTIAEGRNPWGWFWGSDNVSSGMWCTGDGTLYITEAGASRWLACARYDAEPAMLSLTFTDGSRQVWHRRRRVQVLGQIPLTFRAALSSTTA